MSELSEFEEDIEWYLGEEIGLSPEERKLVAQKMARYIMGDFIQIEEVADVAVDARKDEMAELARALSVFAISRMDPASFQLVKRYVHARGLVIDNVASRETTEHEHKCDLCGRLFWTHSIDCPVRTLREPEYNKWGRCLTCGAEEGQSHDPNCMLGSDSLKGGGSE